MFGGAPVTTLSTRRAQAAADTTTAATVAKVLDAVPEAIVVIGRDGHVDFANRKLERLCGYRRGELVGLAVDRLILEPERAPGTGACIRKDTGCFPATIHASKMAIDGTGYAIFTIRDDSDRWQAEEQLTQEAMRDPLTGL